MLKLVANVFYALNLTIHLGAIAQPGSSSNYSLVWSDEFSVAGSPSSDQWFHQTQLPAGGSWFNGEQQHYTNRLLNSSVSNGVLKITARRENFTDQGQTKQFTSARLNSKFAFTYGRVDVRAKLPSGAGTWPAIWMLGQNVNEPGGFFSSQFGTVNWPACGEIDVMEHWGNNPNVIHGSIHTPSSFGSTINTKTKVVPDVSNTFHVYSIIWDETKIEFLIDDASFYTYSPTIKNSSSWPFDKPQYLLLNIAMGGIGGTIDPTFTESTLEVDYVRVFQKQVVPLARNQSIIFPPIADKTIGDLAFQLSATASSNLPVTYSSDLDNIAINGNMVTMRRPGRAAITARQSGNLSFNAAPEVTQSFCIKPLTPTITVVKSNANLTTLVSNATIGNRWFLNGVAIPSATGSSLSIAVQGIYKVRVVVDDCESEFSEDISMLITGDVPAIQISTTLYPNPIESDFEIRGICPNQSTAMLTNLLGQRTEINLRIHGETYRGNIENMPPGIYNLQLVEGNKLISFRIIKQ